jgi:nucleoside-diphosphate-sugar epimerase
MTLSEYARLVGDLTGYDGEIVFDTSKPDGMFRKIVDSSKINTLGWKPKTPLREGIRLTYEWYLNNIGSGIRG